MKPLEGDALIEARLMMKRLREAQQQLGAVDVQIGQLEAQRAELRTSCAREMKAASETLNKHAQALGLDGPGWFFDDAAGEFRRAP